MPFFPVGQTYSSVRGSPLGLGCVALSNNRTFSARGRGSYASSLNLAFWAGYNPLSGAVDRLAVINPASYVQQSSVPYTYTGALVFSCAFNAANGFLYVLATIAGAGRVLKVNASTGALVSTINLPASMTEDILYCTADQRVYVSGSTGRLVAINNDDSVQDIANLGDNFLAGRMAHVPVVDRIYVTIRNSANNSGQLLFYNIAANTFSTISVPAINNSITALNNIAYSPTAQRCILGVEATTGTGGVDFQPILTFNPASDSFAVVTDSNVNSGTPRGFFYFPATDQFFCLLQSSVMAILDASSSGFANYAGAVTVGSTSGTNDSFIPAIVDNKFFMQGFSVGTLAVFQANN